MLMNLLAVEGYPKFVSLGEAALYALIGFLVVFAGIGFLILVVWLVGKIVTKMEKSTKVKKDTPIVKNEIKSIPAPQQSDEIDEETVAIIMAALMAYYEQNNPKCEFTVKRIKRVRRNEYA